MTRHAVRIALPAALAAAVLAAAMGPLGAQMSADDAILRIDRLESQIRQLTGSIEQLQYRNQQLEQSLKRLQEDNEFRFQELGGKGGARAAPPRPAAVAPQPQYQPPPPAAPGRRSDVFDPSQNPTAPGAPRTLGTTAGSAPPPQTSDPVGAPGGRDAGSPLDLSTLSANAVRDPSLAPAGDGSLPPPPPRNPNATGARVTTLPPTSSPRDEFDLAYGYILRKDYALAEQGFRTFLQKHPSDRLAPDAQYWLGESMFQRQNWRDAADAFLSMSKKYKSNPKAAEALLQLGQSLAALREKELACATFGEVARKYPRASTTIKQAIEREQKRIRC